jgi:hypothetical protein
MSGIEFKQAIHLTPKKESSGEAGGGRRLMPWLVFAAVAALHLYFYTHLSETRRDGGWPSIVLRNWHDYGYWQMHGQLVVNSGGLDSGEEQFICPGHRPTFLIPAYWLKELPGAAFHDGALYDFALLGATFAAMLALFGANWRGLLLGAVVCFTPGFISNVSDINPIGTPALLGLAVMAFAASRFARMENDISIGIAALAVVLAYMIFNWSTLFMLGIAAVYVFCKRADWKTSAAFFLPPLLVGLIVLAVSMHDKSAANTSAGGGDFWNAYLWGPLGYDRSGMTFGKAFVRITAVNIVAWLSLAIAGFVVVIVNGLGDKWRRAVWPLLAGVAAVFALRNYNAHHPWNAVCEIGLGLLFSIELLTDSAPLAFPKWRRFATGAALAFALAYVVAWLALDAYNGRNSVVLRELVVNNTPRNALVVVAGALVPVGDATMKEYSEVFDRHLVALDAWDRQTTNREVFVLTHETLPDGATLVAQSHAAPAGADKIIGPLFDFYRTKISRRAPGNRKDYYDDYQLGKF